MTMQAIIAIALCLLFGFLPVSSDAKEYFVSPQGKDSADGLSEKNPFGTIGKGVVGLKPGDTLTILPGTYLESVSANISGTSEAPITIRAQRPGTVLMRGNVDISGFKAVAAHPYVYVVPFAQRVEGVAERSTRMIYEPQTSLIEVERRLGSFLQDEKKGLLYIHTSDSNPPDGKALTVSLTNACGLLFSPPQGSSTASDIIVDGLSFTGYQSRDLSNIGGSRARWGLSFLSPERVTVRRCVAFLNDGGIAMFSGRNSTIEDCHAFGNRARFISVANNIIGWTPYNLTFRRNVVEGYGYYTGDSLSDIAFYSGGTGGVMERNLAINAGIMIKGVGSDPAPPVYNKNRSIGKGAYYYEDQANDTNLLLADYLSPAALAKFADPVHYDFRPQASADAKSKSEVFYVSPGGNDENDGASLARAWRTLARAAKSASPGETIYITAGEYHEMLAPAQSGTVEAPIHFVRYGHDRVVLNGDGKLANGVDLAGRSNVRVEGLIVQGFKAAGVHAADGSNIQIERCVLVDCGVAIVVTKVQSFLLRNGLIRNYREAGISLENCERASLMGNILDRGKGAAIRCDDATIESLWSDYNDISPSLRNLASVGKRPVHDLADWRKEFHLDAHSIAVEPEYGDATRGDFSLPDDSRLAGRGPLSDIIGPYWRHETPALVAIKDLRVKSVTATTVNLEWWTPSRKCGSVLTWGPTPDSKNELKLPESEELVSAETIFHTVSLAGLKPGERYYFRVAALEPGATYRWSVYADNSQPTKPPIASPRPDTFQTFAKDKPARTFHVSVTGDDANSGLDASKSWRTLSHAATEVCAGDTVLIHGGQYQETVRVRATGDKDRPITFRAAPGEQAWLDGDSDRLSMAFQLIAKHHIHIDGLYFRHFAKVDHADDVINIQSGTDHVVRRCFYDGRRTPGGGLPPNFIRGYNTKGLLVENSVMVCGFDGAILLYRCDNTTVRHSVFFNNYIRALTFWTWNPAYRLTLSHNLFCDTIPGKGNALVRVMHLENLKSDHNGFHLRNWPVADREIVEITNMPVKPEVLKMDVVRVRAGQERSSLIGNPNIAAARELLPIDATVSDWEKAEMRMEKGGYAPLDFKDFTTDPKSPLAQAADGKPIGLDPAAFSSVQ